MLRDRHKEGLLILIRLQNQPFVRRCCNKTFFVQFFILFFSFLFSFSLFPFFHNSIHLSFSLPFYVRRCKFEKNNTTGSRVSIRTVIQSR